MLRTKYLMLTLILAGLFSVSKAQLYAYLEDPSGAYAGIAANVTATNLSRFNGTTEDPACGTGFSSNHHSTSLIYTNNRPGIQFTITPDAGFQIDVTNIDIDIRRNPKGPTLWRIAYSTDGGGTWTTSGADFFVASSGCFTNTNLAWDVDDFSTNFPLLIRIIGFSAHSGLNGVSTLKNIDVQGTVSYADGDGDGFTSDVDCNDADPSINPDAIETCNGVDDNCNGIVDDGAGDTWYADVDGDGYGDATSTIVACEMPGGYIADNTDCNDADPSVNPGASEICNGIDDDCNGSIDDGVLFATWYADVDGDGYGDAASAVETCDGAPAGYVGGNTDCNDGDPSINPGATEVCNSVDDNCDGTVDEGIDLSIAISPDGVIELCKPDEVTLTATAGFDSYNWFKNGVTVVGESTMTYTTNKPAYYQVEGILGTCSSGLSAVQAVAVYESPNANLYAPDGADLCFANPAQLKASYGDDYIYVWYFNGSVIEGAIEFTYDATEIGDYYVVITNASGCTRSTETLSVINTCKTGVENNVLSLNIFPNPVNNRFSIEFNTASDYKGSALISISDVTGRVVYTTSSEVLNGFMTKSITLENSFSSGIYYIAVESDGNTINQQFVIVK